MRKTAYFALWAVLLLVIATPVGAVTNGLADGTQHPYVGLIVFYSGFDTGNHPIPMWRCSGSLLSDTVFLTAAHCVSDPTPAFASIWFVPEPQGQTVGQPTDYTKYPYGGYNASATKLIPMPGYLTGNLKSGGLPGFDYHDVAVVIIDRWFTDMPSGRAQLPAQGLVDTLRMKAEVTIVGYGVQYQRQIPGSAYPPPGQDDGNTPPYLRWTGRTRMYAPSQLVQSKDVISSEFLKLTANTAQGKGGVCFGDSGGPIFLGDNTVIGVNSFGSNVNCSGLSYSNRIDIADILAWIDIQLQNNP